VVKPFFLHHIPCLACSRNENPFCRFDNNFISNKPTITRLDFALCPCALLYPLGPWIPHCTPRNSIVDVHLATFNMGVCVHLVVKINSFFQWSVWMEWTLVSVVELSSSKGPATKKCSEQLGRGRKSRLH